VNTPTDSPNPTELGRCKPEKGPRRAPDSRVNPTRLQEGVRHEGPSRRGTTPDRNRRGLGRRSRHGATYLNITPARNDGTRIYKLSVKDVPVDGFWSVSVHNAEGYFQKNEYGAYALNNLTAKKSGDGSIAIQFGGCDGKIADCIPIVPGWNYMVRLHRPRAEILNGKWTFPQPVPVSCRVG
jgi:hypothetical protein